MIYREATQEDLPEIARLGELFFNESGYQNYTTYKYSSVFETLNFLVNSDMGILVVAEKEKIIGFAGLILFPFHFNHDVLCGQEISWYVNPRGCGNKLYDYLEEKAREKGCCMMIMIALESLHPELVGKFYKRKGYNKNENLYIKVL